MTTGRINQGAVTSRGRAEAEGNRSVGRSDADERTDANSGQRPEKGPLRPPILRRLSFARRASSGRRVRRRLGPRRLVSAFAHAIPVITGRIASGTSRDDGLQRLALFVNLEEIGARRGLAVKPKAARTLVPLMSW